MGENRAIRRDSPKTERHGPSRVSQTPSTWVAVTIGCLTILVGLVANHLGCVEKEDRAEQQRPRLSMRIELENIDDPAGFRIVAPLEIGGTTDARRVTLKNFVTTDKPGERDYISAIDVDWKNREGHLLGDLSTTEKNRRFLTPPLSRQRLETILSTEESLYFVARLEYCDIQDDCYYFMRCAEFGHTGVDRVVIYCGTRTGDLMKD